MFWSQHESLSYRELFQIWVIQRHLAVDSAVRAKKKQVIDNLIKEADAPKDEKKESYQP